MLGEPCTTDKAPGTLFIGSFVRTFIRSKQIETNRSHHTLAPSRTRAFSRRQSSCRLTTIKSFILFTLLGIIGSHVDLTSVVKWYQADSERLGGR
jgi:hypothetical protein